MTRIQPKAPSIPQPPRREQAPGEAAGKNFHEILAAKPGIERRETASSSQRETQAIRRDSRPDDTSSHGDLEQSMEPPAHDAVHADAGRSVYPSAYSEGRPYAELPVSSEAPTTSDVCSAQMREPPTPSLGESAGSVSSEGGAIDGLSYGMDVPPGMQDPNKASPGTVFPAPLRQLMLSAAAGTAMASDRAEDPTAVASEGVLFEQLPSSLMTSASIDFDQAIVLSEDSDRPDSPATAMQLREAASDSTMSLVPDSGSAQPLQPVLIETSMGQDNQDWLIRPWRLQANAGLSFRSNHSSSGVVLESVSAVAGAVSPTAHFRPVPSSAESIDGGSLPARWKSLLRLPVHIESAAGRLGADGVEGSDSLGAKGGQAAALLQWSQRMLRWNGNATGADGVTAWVRDYALEASELPALIHSLVALAVEQGFSLERIMVNGHEAWSSAGQHHMTRGDNDGR